mmetsp:Transcript_9045/g.27562  ORF Transcript_9045/g.27562 Transcript_9045/m.27562 type:complete len:312 (+) Transcript_9045:146-1081(+)
MWIVCYKLQLALATEVASGVGCTQLQLPCAIQIHPARAVLAHAARGGAPHRLLQPSQRVDDRVARHDYEREAIPHELALVLQHRRHACAAAGADHQPPARPRQRQRGQRQVQQPRKFAHQVGRFQHQKLWRLCVRCCSELLLVLQHAVVHRRVVGVARHAMAVKSDNQRRRSRADRLCHVVCHDIWRPHFLHAVAQLRVVDHGDSLRRHTERSASSLQLLFTHTPMPMRVPIGQAQHMHRTPGTCEAQHRRRKEHALVVRVSSDKQHTRRLWLRRPAAAVGSPAAATLASLCVRRRRQLRQRRQQRMALQR